MSSIPGADPKSYALAKGKLTEAGIYDGEEEIQYATKLKCRSGTDRGALVVYNTGTVKVEARDSTPALKDYLTKLKAHVEKGAALPGSFLPAETDEYPQTLKERVPDCDDVVMWCYKEAVQCLKCERIAAAAFMLGAASEKTILLLIDAYAAALPTDRREKFFTKVNNRMISVKFDEFQKSYAGQQAKPTDPAITQDLDQLIEGPFHFYKFNRNQVGHPQIIPDIDKLTVMGNIGQFITYAQRIYKLMEFFKNTKLQ